NIGVALRSQGRYDEALVYYQKDLKISIKVLGEEHPDVAASYNNIGDALKAQGKHDEASVYYKKASAIT
ncbi:MAG TPA: tetratricopeptide repeat protein, partial [Waddliaceae bacterium]